MSGRTESRLRECMAMHGASLHARGLVPGSSGNISVRLDDGMLVTPTNSCMGRIDPGRISKLDSHGRHVSGDQPSKEAFLHRMMLAKRPQSSAVVHLHSTHAVAVSCCQGLDECEPIPALTPYYVMKIGRLRLLPYFAPGDEGLAHAVEAAAGDHHAILLANHGPVVAGSGLDNAVYAIEELEESARLFLMLAHRPVNTLNDDQVSELHKRFPN